MQKLVFLAFIAVFLLAACSPADLDFQYSDLPQGDAGRGKDLFAKSINGTVACSNCHTLSGGDTAGPTLQDYGPTAASRVEGQTAEEYTFYSTLQPSKYLVAGFSNVMPSNYDEKLSKQEIADLIAYMLTLGIDEEGIAAQPSQGGNNTVDISMIVFRVIHIFAAVFMAGFALFMLVFVEPAITAMGTDTQGFMRGFYKSAKRYETVLTILAMLTLLSGIVLFYRVSDHFNADWLASTPGVVLIISSAMVIVSYAHGGMVTGQLSKKTANLMEEIGLQDNPPTEEQHMLMREIQAKHRLHGWIDSGLMVVAGVLMVSARYL